MAAEASKLRERLLGEAQSLARHGLVDGAQLAQLKGANGYNNIGQDLQVLSITMRSSWEKINGRTPSTVEDLDHALRLSARLTRILGQRDQGPARLAAATETRLRAFTIAIRTYDEMRRAVGYLRTAEGDLESIVPSLYPGKSRRKQADPASDETQVPDGAVAPPAPGSAPGAAAPAGTSATSDAKAPGAGGGGFPPGPFRP